MSPRILYIDDESDLVELAISFFSDEDLPIDASTTFQGALTLIRRNRYDLIISDVRMPSGNGHELLGLVQKEGLFDGKIILLTGNVDEKNDPHKMKNYDLILYKPIEFHDLIAKVKQLLSI